MTPASPGGFGGGGGGVYTFAGVATAGSGGFGGGGGGAYGGYNATGGNGGYGGGGGAAGALGLNATAGNGGFGGGGGSAIVFNVSGTPTAGSGGFGGGAAGTAQTPDGGGGGLGAGGAVYVQSGGSVTVSGSLIINGNSVAGGGVGGGTATNGSAFGGGIFFQGSYNTPNTIAFGAGAQSISDVIADYIGSGGTNPNSGTQANDQGGSLVLAKTGGGTLTLGGANTYSGGTSAHERVHSRRRQQWAWHRHIGDGRGYYAHVCRRHRGQYRQHHYGCR